MRPDQWLGTRRRLDDLDSDATLEAIGRRYLGAYGPATYRDFATWWGGGTGRGQAKRMMRSLASEIVEVSIEGKPGWMLAKDATQAKKAAAVETVRLLPHFDGYTLHFRPREHLVPTRFAARIFRNQGWISPVLLINGMAAGTWELARTGRNFEVRLQPFAPLRPAFLRKIREEVDRLAHFLGGRVRVTD
ncbi:MAG: winged helix DNA-binding domain-containing protein [Bacillati bacterium ANGP1]|uniref:Winged helix DNA-binding domain-containing protein n=1 Tax=Candidatus Segetimicrobium genomatis TaxID=2569760 RepID=A0A537LQM3_9BACT|nr:MAG: winged helix DNA-binding domain-containing protein [Terrabacteria group bacterium ANGP1]